MALKNLVFRYCGEQMSKGLQCSFRLGEELTAEQIDDCRKDLEYLPIILKKQQERIKTLGLESVIETEMNMVPSTVWLELSGIHYDDEKLRAITIELQTIAKNLSYELYQAFGSSKFKLSSSPAMIKKFNEKGIMVQSINKEELAKFEDPLIDKYTEWREHYDLIIKFVKTLPKHKYNKTGRVYASFKQYGTKSGRFSCRFPNLQQQPSKYKNWRTIFTAEPGNKIVACDYSQIELRILGEIANEPEFIKAYSQEIDLHKLTASKVFSIPIESVSKESRERSIAKPINFGLNYGMSSPGLIKKLRTEAEIELSKPEADAYISTFKKAYPAITLYLQNISQKGAVERELRNAAGRRLVIGQDKDENGAGREAMNLPIQSLCADMIKEALPEIQAKLEPLGVKLVNMVHDELVFECKAEIADYVCQVAKEEMIKSGSRYLKKIPCLVDGKPSDYWTKE
jgi:DNA polymerase-1